MDLNFGINGSISAQAAKPITVKSTTVIGMLAAIERAESKSTKSNTLIPLAELSGLRLFNNASDAADFCQAQQVGDTAINALKAIALQGVVCPIVLNLCESGKELDALDLFKATEGLTGVSIRNGLIIAPELSADLALGTKLDAIAQMTWATALIDNFSANETDVMTWQKNYSSRHVLLCHGRYKVENDFVPCSALYAGLIAYYDSLPFGWAKSHSNRVVKGVYGSERVIEYLDGSECEARRLRQNGVAMILPDIGWRSYGFETTDIDVIWQSLDRTRTFYRLLSTILKASKYARDREANELLTVRQSIIEFMNELKGNEVVIGFDVFFDEEKNTKATVTAGKFYLTVKVGDMPSVRELNIELVYSDDWNDALINYINSDSE